MAKWKFGLNSPDSSIKAKFEYDSGQVTGDSNFEIYQDEKPFLDEVKRNIDNGTRKTHMNHRKFATIPDIVSIEIKEKYGIDIHDPLFMNDKDKMIKFKQIVMTDYPYLVVNKA